MSTRWFFPWARTGAGMSSPDPQLRTSVTFTREMDGRSTPEHADGPTLTLVGPADVLGFDRTMVLREEPPPGGAPAAENVLATVELAHADLPWLLPAGEARPTGAPPVPAEPTPLPWVVLVVLDEDEAAAPRHARPLPVLTAPVAALPPLADRWAWAHVEARLADSVTDLATATRLASAGMRSHSAGVVGRLLCPRRLRPDRGWIAAVVPATNAGVAAGLDRDVAGPPLGDAWPNGAGTIELPVYHWWRFRTGDSGTFEELARRLRFRPAADAGLGSRTIDVNRPWPAEPATGPATVTLDGALRVPRSAGDEDWSDTAARDRFRGLLRQRLDPPLRQPADDGDVAATDPVPAVGPPLYGSHHTGQQTVPDDSDSWMATLNIEVRRRVAASLGARYVQLEQEFLMARAWDQVGEITQANRLLAATELAAAAAEQAQRKHLDGLDVADLVTVMAPVANRVRLPAEMTGGLRAASTLAVTLAASPVPTGVASTAFARLTRPNGAIARRTVRVAGGGPDGGPADSVIHQGLVAGRMIEADAPPDTGLAGELRAAVDPFRLQMRRMADRIPAETWAHRSEQDARPLRPIMMHPTFTVPIAEELLSRWPEWAIPGIGSLPADSVTPLETNPEFVAALLVGLNDEFNRELLWREFPTDQRGTPFARFWPTDGPDVDEIARWPLDGRLGSQVRTGESSLALLVRGELLRRFPGTALLAVRGEGGRLPTAFAGLPGNPLVLDESTVLYLFTGLDADQAIAEDWFFVFREPMRGTQFGFDTGDQPVPMRTWADLTWEGVAVEPGQFVQLARRPRNPDEPPPVDPPQWGRDSADQARIAFQQPFQLAFRAGTLLRA